MRLLLTLDVSKFVYSIVAPQVHTLLRWFPPPPTPPFQSSNNSRSILCNIQSRQWHQCYISKSAFIGNTSLNSLEKLEDRPQRGLTSESIKSTFTHTSHQSHHHLSSRALAPAQCRTWRKSEIRINITTNTRLCSCCCDRVPPYPSNRYALEIYRGNGRALASESEVRYR